MAHQHTTSHQPLIDMLNNLKKAVLPMAEEADRQMKGMLDKLNPKEAAKYKEQMEEMKQHIEAAESLNIHEIVKTVTEKVHARNKENKK